MSSKLINEGTAIFVKTAFILKLTDYPNPTSTVLDTQK